MTTERDRPGMEKASPQIEVTPEMMDAAFDYIGDGEITAEMVKGIFRAMIDASLRARAISRELPRCVRHCDLE